MPLPSRTVTAFVAAIVFAAGLTGCGGSDSNKSNPGTPQVSSGSSDGTSPSSVVPKKKVKKLPSGSDAGR